jgi:hypothetical protein
MKDQRTIKKIGIFGRVGNKNLSEFNINTPN